MKELSIDEYKERILNVLIKIDKICRENGYHYMICFGTLLGAVRHQGFIPWDDDIDIVLPRDDYYKLGQYILKHPELELNYIDISNRSDAICYCAKVCDVHTTVKEANFHQIEGYGAFVDVFPLDYLPDNEKERQKYMKKALHWERIVQHSAQTHPGKGRNSIHTILLIASFVYAHCFSTNRILHKMHDTFSRNSKKETGFVGIPYETAFIASDFEKTTELVFEGHSFIAPLNYDNILRTAYGNYMELPSDDMKTSHYLKCYKLLDS